MEALKAELEGLKQAMAATTVVKPPAAQSQPGNPRAGRDSNAAVIDAIRKYVAALAAIPDDMTDIQQREQWLGATKQLDAVLRQNAVTISLAFDDVYADGASNTAMLSVASVMIKSPDPTVAHLVFISFGNIRIEATEEEARQINKTSKAVMRGTLALGLDLSKPASEQPTQWYMPGYRALGEVQDISWRVRPTIMIKQGFVFEVDGVPRKTR